MCPILSKRLNKLWWIEVLYYDSLFLAIIMWPSDYTMTIFCEALVVFLLVPVLDALAIQPAQAINQPNLNLLVPQPLSTGSSALQVKTSSQLNAAFNASSKAFFRGERTDCNAAFYGVPAISSCLDVYKQMTDSDKVSVFGDRTRGIFEYPLPYRFTSSQSIYVIRDRKMVMCDAESIHR